MVIKSGRHFISNDPYRQIVTCNAKVQTDYLVTWRTMNTCCSQLNALIRSLIDQIVSTTKQMAKSIRKVYYRSMTRNFFWPKFTIKYIYTIMINKHTWVKEFFNFLSQRSLELFVLKRYIHFGASLQSWISVYKV